MTLLIKINLDLVTHSPLNQAKIWLKPKPIIKVDIAYAPNWIIELHFVIRQRDNWNESLNFNEASI